MIKDVLDAACHTVNEELKQTPLSVMNECVFRFFFVQQLLHICKDCRCQIEWHKVDLLVQKNTENILIEFKFFLSTRAFNLTGDKNWLKGGPSKKNFLEFADCIRKLSNIKDILIREGEMLDISKKYLILAYVHTDEAQRRKSYHHYYEQIELPEGLKHSVINVQEAPRMYDGFGSEYMICKLIELG